MAAGAAAGGAGMPWGQIVGTATNIVGTLLKGEEAERARRELKDAAKTPGLDLGAITGGALEDLMKYLPQGSAVAERVSQINQANLNAREEANMPGVGAARQKLLSGINTLSDDNAWLADTMRTGAAMGATRGVAGYGAGKMGMIYQGAKDKMARLSLGTGLLSQLIGSMRVDTTSPSVTSFLSPTPAQAIQIRSDERTQKMSLMAKYALMPTRLSEYGQNLQEYGGALMGSGSTGGYAGFDSPGSGGSSSGTGVSGSQQDNMMKEYTSGMGWVT